MLLTRNCRSLTFSTVVDSDECLYEFTEDQGKSILLFLSFLLPFDDSLTDHVGFSVNMMHANLAYWRSGTLPPPLPASLNGTLGQVTGPFNVAAGGGQEIRIPTVDPGLLSCRTTGANGQVDLFIGEDTECDSDSDNAETICLVRSRGSGTLSMLVPVTCNVCTAKTGIFRLRMKVL